jgi:hypothetical protein
MATTVRVTIKGAGESGANAPTVDDLFGQVHDFVDILEGVEKALSDDHTNQIVWRVTDAARQNPISFELTPTPTNPAIYIDSRAAEVERATLQGMRDLRLGEARPAYFSDDTLAKVRKLHERVTNGLATTTIALDDNGVGGALVIDQEPRPQHTPIVPSAP